MKRILFAFSLALFQVCAFAQTPFTAPWGFNYSAPTGAPSALGTRVRFDITTGRIYTWSPDALNWQLQGYTIDQISGTSAPAYAPVRGQSWFAVNGDTLPRLYQYTGSGTVWKCLNCSDGKTYTAGAGIAISGGTVISNTGIITEVDGSTTNELNTGFDISGGNLRVIDAGATRTVALTSIAPVQSVTGGTGITVSGINSLTVTNTGDLSNTNELQTLSISGSDLSLSNGGGTVTVPPGGIYGGSGPVPPSTIATLTGNFNINYPSNNSAFSFSQVSGLVSLLSDDQQTYIEVGNDYLSINGFGEQIQLNGAGIYVNSLAGTGIQYSEYYSGISNCNDCVPSVRNVRDIISDSLRYIGIDGYAFQKIPTLGGEFENFLGHYRDINNYSGWLYNNAEDGQLQLRSQFNEGYYSSVFAADNKIISFYAGDDLSSSGMSFSADGSIINSGPGGSGYTIAITNAGILAQTFDNKGIRYEFDYSDTIKLYDRSIPDVGTTKEIIAEQVKSGYTTGTTDASGFFTVTHGLGSTPTTVVATYQGSTPETLIVTAKTSTTFTVRMWNMLDGAWDSSTSIGVNWICK